MNDYTDGLRALRELATALGTLSRESHAIPVRADLAMLAASAAACAQRFERLQPHAPATMTCGARS